MAIEEKEEQTTSLKDLIELVEKDLIPTNVFTIEDKDPMVILGKLNEVIAYLKNLQATINSSDTKANQALESAINALSSASESLQASTTALNSSNLALETANLAIDTANTSLAGSNEAKTASNEAIAMANNALQIAQDALNQVVGSLGTKVYDNNGNLKSSVKFAGHNGINVDMADDNETFDIRLDEDITKAIEDNHTAIEQTKAQAQANKEDIANLSEMVADNEESTANLNSRVTNAESNLSEINPKVARALLTPMSAPSELKLVGIDTSNNQEMLNVGGGLKVENGTLKASLTLNEIYPIGSVYMSVNSTSPASLFGGTWEQLKDRFLLGAGDIYANNTIGGQATVTLTIEQMPTHKHLENWGANPIGDSYGNGESVKCNLPSYSKTATSKSNYTNEVGGNQPHTNMPPYLVVYMWKRVG